MNEPYTPLSIAEIDAALERYTTQDLSEPQRIGMALDVLCRALRQLLAVHLVLQNAHAPEEGELAARVAGVINRLRGVEKVTRTPEDPADYRATCEALRAENARLTAEIAASKGAAVELVARVQALLDAIEFCFTVGPGDARPVEFDHSTELAPATWNEKFIRLRAAPARWGGAI